MAGLPWIRLEVSAPNHPKVLRLERELEISDGLGMVVRLWCWTATYYPTGEIPAFAVQRMAEVVAGELGRDQISGMHGRNAEVRNADVTPALVTAGLLDPAGDGFKVHDWEDFQLAHIDSDEKRRQQNAERQRRFREKNARNVTPSVTRNVTTVTRGEERRGDKRRREEEEEEACAEHSADAPAPAPPPPEKLQSREPESPVVATLPCVGRGPREAAVTQKQLSEWQEAFPGIDVPSELRKARVWLEANPGKRKTSSGVPRFLVSWFSRAQNDPRRPPTPRVSDEERALLAERDKFYRGVGIYAEPPGTGLDGRPGPAAPQASPRDPDLVPEASAPLPAAVGDLLGPRGTTRQFQDGPALEPGAQRG